MSGRGLHMATFLIGLKYNDIKKYIFLGNTGHIEPENFKKTEMTNITIL
jgi:hypothetical protein